MAFIVHIHVQSKSGQCFWLKSKDGTLTRHAGLAHEFEDDDVSGLAETLIACSGAMGCAVEGHVEVLQSAELPEAIRQLVRLD